MQYCTLLYCIVPYYIVLYYTILYHTVLHYTILYCIILLYYTIRRSAPATAWPCPAAARPRGAGGVGERPRPPAGGPGGRAPRVA